MLLKPFLRPIRWTDRANGPAIPDRPAHIGIVVPVLNEAEGLSEFLDGLRSRMARPLQCDIVLVDGGSSDDTPALGSAMGVPVLSAPRGRGIQMNLGARNVKGDILYFLHADTVPPKGFDERIRRAYAKGHRAGCFRMQFDKARPVLRAFAWMSRFDLLICRGGDQSLFVDKATFEREGGFDARYRVYEDTEFMERLYRTSGFHILPDTVITSARKYRRMGWVRLQRHFAAIHWMYAMGAGPDRLADYYDKYIGEENHSSMCTSA